MPTTVSNRRSKFGINCVRCKEELIAPEKSEYHHGTHIRHLWYCANCETYFEFDQINSGRGHDDRRHFSINSCGVGKAGGAAAFSGILVTRRVEIDLNAWPPSCPTPE